MNNINETYILAYYEGKLICVSRDIKDIKKYLKNNRNSSMKCISIEEKSYDEMSSEELNKEIITHGKIYLTILDYAIMITDFENFMDSTWVSFNNLEEMKRFIKPGYSRDTLDDTVDIYRKIIYDEKSFEKVKSNFFDSHYLWDYPLILYAKDLDHFSEIIESVKYRNTIERFLL